MSSRHSQSKKLKNSKFDESRTDYHKNTEKDLKVYKYLFLDRYPESGKISKRLFHINILVLLFII